MGNKGSFKERRKEMKQKNEKSISKNPCLKNIKGISKIFKY